jgi:hypothetical protein
VGDSPALVPDEAEALGDAPLLGVALAPLAAGVPVAVAVVVVVPTLVPEPDEVVGVVALELDEVVVVVALESDEVVGVVALDTDEPATAVRVPMAALTGVEARTVCTGVKATTV